MEVIWNLIFSSELRINQLVFEIFKIKNILATKPRVVKEENKKMVSKK